MTDLNLGTLAGLIADLENLEPPEGTFDGMYLWYAQVSDLIRHHKRAMYEIGPIFGGYGVYHRTVKDGLPLNSPIPVSYKECEQWIETQVNGDD